MPKIEHSKVYSMLDILIMVKIFNLKAMNLNVLYFCLNIIK